MKVFSEFHDGSLDGVLREGTSAFLFLTTLSKDRSVVRLSGLLSLKMDDFRQGSSVFDVIVRKGNEITHNDIEQLFGFSDNSKAANKLAEAHAERLVVVEINPSYGASLLAIANTFIMMSRKDWLDELVTTEKSFGS